MKTLLISFVLIAVICLTNGISVAAPPPEISKHFTGHGQVHSIHQILSDSDLKHIAVVQHGSLFAIVYAVYADNMWRFAPDDILEVFVAVDQKPFIIWTKSRPNPT